MNIIAIFLIIYIPLENQQMILDMSDVKGWKIRRGDFITLVNN